MKTLIGRVKWVIKNVKANALLIGIASLIWLLYRSGTNPSRLRYPCQQACMVNVSLYLSPAVLLLAQKAIKTREMFNIVAVARATCKVALFLLCFVFVEFVGERSVALYYQHTTPVMPQHAPLGMRFHAGDSSGQPVYVTSPQAYNLPVPNRVVSVHDSKATNWDYKTGYHWEYINQKVVDNMVSRGIKALTGKDNLVAAWKSIIPYRTGDDIAIKLNFNNSSCDDYDNDIDGYPETVNAIIDGLTSIGVPPTKIWVTDPSRRVPKRFRDRIKASGVQFVSRYGCKGAANYHAVDYVASDSADASDALCPAGERIRPSQVFVDAEHLINIPQLKSHGRYVTLALKNHYGSVIYRDNDRSSMHAYFNEGGNKAGCDLERENILACINNNPHIRDKTRLVIGDGLYGNAHTNWKSVRRWAIFNNDDSNILFFSGDPVAISSVMTDYIVAERGRQDHEHLHAAAGMGLGVHEHWDSFESKRYKAIDYRIIELD